MTSDLKTSAEAVQRAIEEFGSVAHLAEALGVDVAQLGRWRDGAEPMPLGVYGRMIELVLGQRK
jgi:hypothetical protein